MKPLNIAHRGGAGLWPENTLLAFESAARAGYDGAELDVQLTADGEVVVFHDFCPASRNCTNFDGSLFSGEERLLRSWTFQELQNLNVGQSVVQRIPTLADVIKATRAIAPRFQLFIELKLSVRNSGLSASPRRLAEAVVATLREHDGVHDSILIGFNWSALDYVRTIAPDLRVWCSSKDDESATRPDSIATMGAEGWFPEAVLATPERIERARALGLKVGVWTVNDIQAMRAAATNGVDAICTDYPDRLATVLGDIS